MNEIHGQYYETSFSLFASGNQNSRFKKKTLVSLLPISVCFDDKFLGNGILSRETESEEVDISDVWMEIDTLPQLESFEGNSSMTLKFLTISMV
ncbi:hypothetical protein NPIL_73191 [Nephila pilipes]|uniref:Uncharacterized protein n=1 Tax=Nephila pilipes TaxID=299642 RepID=A0A8X6T1F6_NEPPI|nr:hypothetical protein NPIL_73191 [Nephila pilipes]